MDRNIRSISIDYLRCFAVLFVVLTHSVDGLYGFSFEVVSEYTIYRKFYIFILLTLGRIGVPLFFFISGYLLLDRQYDFGKTLIFYKRNLLRLILTVEIWIFIYNVFNALYYDTIFSTGNLWRNMLFLKGTNMNHMWYMPVILGIYLFIPLISNVLKTIDIRMTIIPLAIAWIYLFVIPEINLILQWRGYQPIAGQLDLSFSGGYYGIYLIFGYFAKKGLLDKIQLAFWSVLVILGFGTTVFIQIFSYHKGIEYNVWYNNATLFITAFSIFLLGLKLLKNGLGFVDKVVTSLANCSFGIYLIHNPILMCLRRTITTPYNSINSIIHFILALLISWVVVLTFSRIKIVGRIMFGFK